MEYVCTYTGCKEKGIEGRRLDGKLYCEKHRYEVLTGIVTEYLESLSPGEISHPKECAPMRYFLRWLDEIAGWPNGLTLAKVRDRSTSWRFDGDRLEFYIERHPAGMVVQERWAVDVNSFTWHQLSEEKIRSVGGFTKKGEPKCPNCGCSMTSLPGIMKCNNHICRYYILHDHSIIY